jgi:hypothetical protein
MPSAAPLSDDPAAGIEGPRTLARELGGQGELDFVHEVLGECRFPLGNAELPAIGASPERRLREGAELRLRSAFSLTGHGLLSPDFKNRVL